MEVVFWASMIVCLVNPSLGQAEGAKSTTKSAPVLDEVIYQQGKDTLVIQRIEQPEDLGNKSRQESGPQAPLKKPEKASHAVLPTQTYVMTATSYGKKATHFKVWDSGRGAQSTLEGWSNIDWQVLQSVLTFRSETFQYKYLLFYSSHDQEEDLRKIPAELPPFATTGARYTVDSSEAIAREDTLDFIESLHALYDESQKELHEGHDAAVKHHQKRQRQIELKAALPQKRILKIWRHQRGGEDQNGEFP